MDFILASKNPHKLQEMSAILGQYGVDLRLQSELALDIDVEENGASFEENAMIKATAVMRASGLPAIADDSGLEVDALGGTPGIYSARYGGEACQNDRQRYELLLENLKGVPTAERTARFVCVIAAVWPDGRKICVRGTCEGRILTQPGRDNGFGYDPVFYVPAEGCTFSEMPQARKNEISHRANALRLFQTKLTEG